uniref:Integrase core domain containing protein n=1 Tax=Solanum tuberosum TaxID=4113 RepID=M1DN35_SOLTU
MATLLHHVKPWMQKSIADFEAMMETMVDQKVQVVHKRLDAFKFTVLARPAPVTDFSSIRTELDSLWADIDSILVAPTDEPESAPTALADNNVLDALLSEDTDAQPEPTRSRGNRHRSSQNSNTTEETRVKKREHQRTGQA